MPLENVNAEDGVQNEQVQSEEKQYSPVELKALEMGWRPLEEFDGDESEFIDAKEFVGRAPLFEKIESQKAAIKQTNQALEALKEHYVHVEKTAYNKAMKDIKAQQNKAIAEGDVETFNALEDQKTALEVEKEEFEAAAAKIKTEAPQVHPEFQSWINRNKWYVDPETPHMRVFADKLGMRLAEDVRRGSMTQQEAFKKIDSAVKEEFPHKFRNPNRDKPSTVEDTGKKTSKANTGTFRFSPEQEKVWKTLERSKVMTKEQYIADLKKMENE